MDGGLQNRNQSAKNEDPDNIKDHALKKLELASA